VSGIKRRSVPIGSYGETHGWIASFFWQPFGRGLCLKRARSTGGPSDCSAVESVTRLCRLLASGIGTCIKHRNEPNYASLGASGAILAVLFASIVYFPRSRLLILPIPIPIPAPLFAVVYLAWSYYSSRNSQDRINHDAHIAGALTGIAFVALTDPHSFVALLRHLKG